MTYVEGSDAENAPSRRTALWQEGKANHIFRKCIQLNLTVNDKDWELPFNKLAAASLTLVYFPSASWWNKKDACWNKKDPFWSAPWWGGQKNPKNAGKAN